MFAYGIAEPWNKIEGKELEVVRRAINDSIDGTDVRRLNLDRIDRGPTPFYGRETGDDDRTASVRLYRVDVHNENTDMYCLVFLPIGWATETNDPHGPPQAQEAHAQQRPRVTLIPLDKTSSPIHEMNHKHKPSLFDNSKSELSQHDEHNVLHYLRFFCEFVHGGNPESTSPFYIIDSSHEATINPDGIESIRLARESQGPSPSADHRTIDQSAGANTDAKTGNDAVPLTAKPHEEATKNIDDNAKILDQPIKPRWVLDPERPSELIGIKDSRAVVEARVVYGKVGYTARFFVHSSGMIEMSGDLPELSEGTVTVVSPREIFVPEMRYDTYHAHTMSSWLFHALLRGELPTNLPPCVSIRDGVVEVRDVNVISGDDNFPILGHHERKEPNGCDADTTPPHARHKIWMVNIVKCTLDGKIDLNNRKIEHALQFVDVVAESFSANGATFGSLLFFSDCSFIGNKIIRRKEYLKNNYEKNSCAIQLSGTSFASDLKIIRCLACANHVRIGQEFIKPLLIINLDRPTIQLNLGGSRSNGDLWIINNELWGKIDFTRACVGFLWCQNCIIIGDLELSWMTAKVILIENLPSRSENLEIASLLSVGSRRRRPRVSERCGVAGHVTIGWTKVEKNLRIHGVYIADSLTVWQSEMLSIDLGQQRESGASSSTTIRGALSISDSIVHTSATFQGLKVIERGYKQGNIAKSAFSNAAATTSSEAAGIPESSSSYFKTKQWRSLNDDRNLHEEQGWKLSDDGRIAIRDSRIGFDLAIAGVAAKRNAPLWQRLASTQSAESDNGIELEGLDIGGDLDFRGFKTKQDIRVENVRITGHVRAGLQTLIRELHNQSTTDSGNSESRIIANSHNDKITYNDTREPLWTTHEEAKKILEGSRTECRSFHIRTSRVTGDMRLDGLTARSQQKQIADDDGSVIIHSCHIDGDISFILNDELSKKLYIKYFKILEDCPINNFDYYIPKTKIQGCLDLTHSVCGYFLISSRCFEKLTRNDREITVRFNKFKSHRFELNNTTIDRICDLDSLDVGSWIMHKDPIQDDGNTTIICDYGLNKDISDVDISLLKAFLEKDLKSPRNIYTSIERLYLSHGEMDYAEQIRKQMWKKLAKKDVRGLLDVRGVLDVRGILTWPKYLMRKIAEVYGYGGTVSLLSPALLFIAIAAGLSFYVCLGVPTLAFEPSLLCSIAGSDSTIPAADTSAIGYADAVLLAARSTLPGLGLLIADDLRPASTPLPYWGGISMSHIMDFVSIFGWICWALTAIVISMRIFRSAGLR